MIEFQKLSNFFFPFITTDPENMGNFYYDLHFHTTASDGFIKPEDIKNFIDDKQYLVSITDHNEIAGAIKAHELGINNVPGMELGCEDGFELLIYFKTFEDLEDFYRKKLEPFKNPNRMAKSYKGIFQYLDDLKEYECHKSIPHICGLAQKHFISNKNYIFELIEVVDSIETHNHALPSLRNTKAEGLRQEFNKTATFGSDAHIFREIESYYKYCNLELKNSDKVIDYIYKIGSVSGIGHKHLKHLLKNGFASTKKGVFKK